MTEVSYQPNFHIGFSNTKSDVLIHLTQWQYWWWFWFTFLWALYYLLIAKAVRFRTLKFRPRIATTMRPRGKWGDLIVCLIPISWCANILINSNFLLKLTEWQNESSLFTLRIRGKQWYWIYKFDLKNITDILATPKNIGRNKWSISFLGDLQTADDYLHILQLRMQNKWLKNYWSELSILNASPQKQNISTPTELFKHNLFTSKEEPNYLDAPFFTSDIDTFFLKNFWLEKKLKGAFFIKKKNFDLKLTNNYLNNDSFFMNYDLKKSSGFKRLYNFQKIFKNLYKPNFFFKKNFNIKKNIPIKLTNNLNTNTLNLILPNYTFYKFYEPVLETFLKKKVTDNFKKTADNLLNFTEKKNFNFYKRSKSKFILDTYFYGLGYDNNILNILYKRNTKFQAFFKNQNFFKLNFKNNNYGKFYFKKFDESGIYRLTSRREFFTTKLNFITDINYLLKNNFNNITYKATTKITIAPQYNFFKNFKINFNNLFDYSYQNLPFLKNNFYNIFSKQSYFFLLTTNKFNYINNDNKLILDIPVNDYNSFFNFEFLNSYYKEFNKVLIQPKTSMLTFNRNIDFFESSRFFRRSYGNTTPLRFLKLPLSSEILKNDSQFENVNLFKVKKNTGENTINAKPIKQSTFLTVKQKRYKRRKNVGDYTAFYKPNPEESNNKTKFSGKLFLKNNALFEESNKDLLPYYRMIKKNKNRHENTSVVFSKRMLRTQRTLVLPAHVNITAITNSYDVVHSWFIPGLGLKMDCVPGRATHHTFFIDNVGFYYGQCAEVCGRYHHHMPIRVCALPFEHFLVWWHTFGLPRVMFTNQEKKFEANYAFRKYVW